MHLTVAPYLLLSSFSALTNALYIKNAVRSRGCGTKLFPTLYMVKEASPSTISAPKPPFLVSQDVSATSVKSNRVYTVAHVVDPSFAGSWGCTLHLMVPTSTVLTVRGSAALDVKLVSWPAGSFDPTWNNIKPLIQSGTLSTVTATAGGDMYINSGSCPASGTTTGLTYLFEAAEYLSITSVVSFNASGPIGPYLTFGC